MRFLRRNASADSTDSTDSAAEGTEVIGNAETQSGQLRGYTPSKGRPTPKRRETEAKRRGPVAPPPRTTREALKRNKELRKQNPTSKEDRRAAAKERRERMKAGDEQYLLPRDRGPVKGYVRDLVDSRRSIVGFFMPLALIVFVVLLLPYPQVQSAATLACTLLLVTMAIEGFLNGRRIVRLARQKFPNEVIRGGSVGWYAFVRASQLRKLRLPKPRVKPGQAV